MTSSIPKDEPLDPRVQRTREAVAKAAKALFLEEGPNAVTHVRVAEASGVGRATLYRHYPEPSHLLIAALTANRLPELQPAGESFQDYLLRTLTLLKEQMSSGLTPVFVTLVERSEWDEGMAKLKRELARRGSSYVYRALDYGVEQGELPRDIDKDLAAAQLLGPIFYWRLIRGEEITSERIEAVVGEFVTCHNC